MTDPVKSIQANEGVSRVPARGRGHRVIRQLHLWIGAWGALAAILFGFSGFLQNHRAVLKLPQGESVEFSRLEIEAPETARADPQAMRAWLHDVQQIPIDSDRRQSGAPGDLNGKRVRQPERWQFSGGNARESWNVDYTPGNATVQIRGTRQTALAVLSRLHKGVGGGVAWVLLSDSFALAMIALGVSGLIMWARGRNLHRIAFSVLGVAVALLLLIGGIAIA